MAQQQFVIMPDSSEWIFESLDFQYRCSHANVDIEDNSFDYAGTHCNNGIAGTHVQYNAICRDCDEDISDEWDWSPDEDDRRDDD